ncbi:MAG: hypothetical protein KF805_01480 [Phycisphaeraceae bacterium]|nr:hypothetical protein [Phycisphaeraceae bacterium]
MLNSLMLAQSSGGDEAVGTIGLLIYLAILIVIIAGGWKVFAKAGQPGWACLIPIFNMYILLKVVGRPWWWLILMIIPFVNFIVSIIVSNDLSKSFGRGLGTTLGLIFLPFIFVPILGFGSAEYQGPAAAAN